MKCPNCGLINPDSATRCDCGYDFPSQSMKESYSAPKRVDKEKVSANLVEKKDEHATVAAVVAEKKNAVDKEANVAASQNEERMISAAIDGDVQTLKALIDVGVNVNAKGYSGMTALMHASKNNHIDCVKTLLDAGADIWITNEFGRAALKMAEEKGHHEIVKMLKDAAVAVSQKELSHLKEQLPSDIDELLQDPNAAICDSCGKVASPMDTGEAVGRAIVLLLVAVFIVFVFPQLFGTDFAHKNSMFLTIVFISSLVWAIKIVSGAVNKACPSCGKAPMVRLLTPEGHRLLLAKQKKEKDESPSKPVEKSTAIPQVKTPAVTDKKNEMATILVSVEQLIDMLKDKDENVRRPAVDALVKIGAPAVELLIAALKDKDWRVQQWTAAVLGDIGDKRAVEPLIAQLKDNDSDVREWTATALGKIGDKRAVKPLITRLKKDEDFSVRCSAVEALCEIGDKRAVKPLLAWLNKDKDFPIRSSILAAINKIRSKE